MASLKDIARLSQTATATVSRALRGHPNVDPKTAAKIRKIAAKLGYASNARISSLMSYVRASGGGNFRETLAFVWPDADSAEVRRTYQLGRFESGAVEHARELGYGMDVFYHDYQERRWERLRKILRARNIRGLVWGPVLRSSHAHLSMRLESFASAAIGEGYTHPRLPHARFDHFVGMRTALHRLKRQGCRRIGFALERGLNVRASPLLLASFIASNPAGPFAGRELCHFVDFVKPPDVLAWALKAKPDAILLSHEIKGLEGLPAHPKISWKLRLASLNRISRDPLFPGIDQRQDLIASYACDLVIEQLNRNEFGVPRHPKVVLVEGEWKELAGR